MSLACERDGKLNDKILKKGVLLNRRDNSDFVREVYETVVSMIFNKKSLNDILFYIVEEINKLCYRFYNYKKFVITKAIGDTNNHADRNRFVPKECSDENGKKCYKIGDYKVPLLSTTSEVAREHKMNLKKANNETEYYKRCLPAQVQLALKMEERGRPVSIGTRLEYLITSQGEKQYAKLESVDYFIKHSSVLDIDYLYYLKQLSNPLDQVINVIFKNNNFKGDFVLKQYKYRTKTREAVLNDIRFLNKTKVIFY